MRFCVFLVVCSIQTSLIVLGRLCVVVQVFFNDFFMFFRIVVVEFLVDCGVVEMFICILYIIFFVFYHYGGSFVCFVDYNVFVCCQFFKCSSLCSG